MAELMADNDFGTKSGPRQDQVGTKSFEGRKEKNGEQVKKSGYSKLARSLPADVVAG